MKIYLFTTNGTGTNNIPLSESLSDCKKVKTTSQLKEFILNLLNKNSLNNIKFLLQENTIMNNFFNLIVKLNQKHKQKVVILIDEYDKPILDNIENIELAKNFREILKGFYQIIKDADEYLKFVLLTGVTKFSKVSIFSGLNNLYDITVNENTPLSAAIPKMTWIHSSLITSKIPTETK